MNKRLVGLVMFGVLVCSPAFANSSSANRQTVLNNMTDYLSTVGKSQEDRNEILQERHDIRRDARLKKETRHKNAETRRRMKAQEEAIMQKVRAQNN